MRPATTAVELMGHLAGAAYLMRHATVPSSSIVVVDDAMHRRPIGILTEEDIVSVVADGHDPDTWRVGDVVGRGVITVDATTSVRDAATLMLDKGVRQLPVVDDGSLVGILELPDVCRVLL
jgi:CBS domain-containing protein